MALAGLTFFSWHSSRLKIVAVDDENLYVSGWFTRSVITLSEIEYIYFSAGIGLVVVRSKSESHFSHTIAFMPTWGYTSTPITEGSNWAASLSFEHDGTS